MKSWIGTITALTIFWLLIRWIGVGSFGLIDARTAALWSAIGLASFLFWRDGLPRLRRRGMLAGPDTPLAVLRMRLARGELDLATYRRLRDELEPLGGARSGGKKRTSYRRTGSKNKMFDTERGGSR